MIELSAVQFLALVGLSGGQLLALIGIFTRLGALIVQGADHESRLSKLESSHAPGSPRVPA